MSDPDREHLLGYLLGALEDHEHQQVEQTLERRPDLREQLANLKQRLDPLTYDREHHRPPEGLARRTCTWLSSQIDVALCQPESTGALPRPVTGNARRSGPGFLRERRETSFWTSWSLADVVVTAGIALVAAMLFLPAINHSRHHAQVLACQNNLQQLGIGLQTYAAHHQGLFPQESREGVRAFAGIYGPELVEGQYVTDPRQLLCPASPAQASRRSHRVPRLAEIAAAKDEESRRQLQLAASGDFAYCLGYFVGGEFTGPRDNRRPTFPILADLPDLQSSGFRSVNHAARGRNVLFEDGHVQYLIGSMLGNGEDHFFLNAQGQMRAGVHDRDSVLAPGFVRP